MSEEPVGDGSNNDFGNGGRRAIHSDFTGALGGPNPGRQGFPCQRVHLFLEASGDLWVLGSSGGGGADKPHRFGIAGHFTETLHPLQDVIVHRVPLLEVDSRGRHTFLHPSGAGINSALRAAQPIVLEGRTR